MPSRLKRSTSNALIVILGVLFAVTLFLNWWLAPDASLTAHEFLPNMVRSAAYESFSASPHFADGKTMREPVRGSIPRGFMPLHYAATLEDRARAGTELINPISAGDAKALQRGETVFRTFCQPCHGPLGTGDGPVAQRGYPPPAALNSEKSIQLKDGEMFHVLTYGQNNMPSYAAQISPDDRWKVILFVRSLQKPVPAAGKAAE